MTMLHDILKPQHKTAVVDVGAAAIDGARPYEALLERKLCTVIGFEPQTDLWPKCRPDMPGTVTAGERAGSESYLPDVIGDGSSGLLRICASPGMTGLFLVDEAALELFPGLRKWCRVTREQEVQTRRLDDIDAVGQMDFLKIDAQGSESAIVEGACVKLEHCVAVQAEVQFVRLYKNQPMFRDFDALMASNGFLLHTFPQVSRRMILPYVWPNDPDHAAMNQVFSADAVYMRDFSKLDALTDEAVKQMAMIAHYCFRSFDLAFRCIGHLSARGAIPAGEATRYINSLTAA